MIKCECIKKLKDSQGNIQGYRLKDSNRVELDIQANQLKSAMVSGSIKVKNLKIDKDGRIVNYNIIRDLEKQLNEKCKPGTEEIYFQNFVEILNYISSKIKSHNKYTHDRGYRYTMDGVDFYTLPNSMLKKGHCKSCYIYELSLETIGTNCSIEVYLGSDFMSISFNAYDQESGVGTSEHIYFVETDREFPSNNNTSYPKKTFKYIYNLDRNKEGNSRGYKESDLKIRLSFIKLLERKDKVKYIIDKNFDSFIEIIS